MLEILNRYAHGLASIPVVHALEGRGCLRFMEEEGTFTAGELTRRFSANGAYVDVALRMFVSLGWLRKAADGTYAATPSLAHRNAVPPRIMDLYLFPFAEYADGTAAQSLAPWVELSEQRWHSDDAHLPDFLDGLLIVPLLLALRAQGRLRLAGTTLHVDANAGVRAEVATLFAARGWATPDGDALQLHRSGLFIVERIFVTATAASYRPMFAQAEELLFGDPARVFAHDLEGHETHLDRTMNVVGSGFQHEKYFEALSALVLASFDGADFASQPDVLVDTGCGDGTLLRRLYETVRDRTARGKVLDRHPLRLIAVDYNQKALEAASRTLHDLDFVALKGDIGDPQALAESLRANGVADLARVLHVRSFLDHDRPYIAPEDLDAARLRPRFGDGIFIDRRGNPIPAAELLQSTVEHLRRWADLVNGHGLVLLEVHSLPSEVTARFLDESENFHFDAYHSMSRQFLLEAETFALCAAEAGLFSREKTWRRFPRHLPFTRITLAHLEKQPYSVRHARAGELASLTGAFPEGEFVLEAGGRIAAAVACTPEGDALRVTCAFAAPALEPTYADALLRFVAQYWALKPGSRNVTGIEEARSTMLAPSPARAVAGEVAAKVAAYPFAAEHDPREAERILGQFSFRWLLANLQRMGAMRRAGEVYELDELKRRLGIVAKYHRYFDAMLRRLAVEGLVTLRGDRFETTTLVETYALADVAREVAEFEADFCVRYPACASLFHFTASCLRRYDDIVTGRIHAADVLFAGGSTDTFAEVFRGDAVSDYFNRIVADAVRAVAARAGGQRKVRILEIGAGTGGTTAAVLEALEPFADTVQYCFTDIGPSFVRAARRRFGDRFPWVEYRSLDIEDDLARQGFAPHELDVVIAANVLHDTRDIDFTLRQTHSLLKPGGLLVLNEYTSIKDCLSFSGALLHGWWLFEDPERRLNDNCLLSVPLWAKAFERTHFSLAAAFALPTQRIDDECSQSVMLCEPLENGEPMTLERPAGSIAQFIEQSILTLLGEPRAAGYTGTRPLMELGLDSIELVELRVLLETRFDVKLSPMFLFEHETPEKMAAALGRMLGQTAAEETAAPEVAGDGQPDDQAIAVVGIACRFPGGADSAQAFWRFLERGGNAVAPLPPGRFAWPPSIDVEVRHKGIDRGGFLARIDEFDAPFFRTSAAEAELMDPQQRLLLELSWDAMEDAGHRPSELATKRVGVFAGVCHGDYRELLAAAAEFSDAYAGSGGAFSMLANRISFFYDFKGPSLTVDTACSSSLSALHEAIAAIRRGDCEQALVGAVNLICTPTNSISYYRAGMLSPTGVCRALDAAADGFVRGEGGAMLLLKPLPAALADGDAIYGLVKGTAVNHGGQAASLTAPKPESQAAVVEAAWRAANVAVETAGYLELHGTGTRLGDPVEVGGLAAAFRRLDAGPDFRCGLGAVKTNVGHLEAAAGLAGVIKVLLAMQHRRIPGTLHFERLNPDIDLAGTPFYVVAGNQDWDAPRDARGRELPRRAGVSSFGFGGANAHVVLEEWRALQRAAASEPVRCIVPLSARNAERLREQAKRLLDALPTTDASLRDIAYTLHTGREPMQERVAFAVETRQELAEALQAYIAGIAPQEIEWPRVPVDGGRRVHLPTYAFSRESYWIPRNAERQQASAHSTPDALRRELQAELMRVASRLLTLPAGNLRSDVELNDLGFDSISYAVFADQLNETYGLQLTPTVFYEHSTLERFTRHLLDRHHDTLAAHFDVQAPVTAKAEERRERPEPVRAPANDGKQEPIAIVGMSGRFPMASDIDELWANLLGGRDCIREIPPQRWDWRAVYGEAGQENRTDVKWGGFIEGVDEFDPVFFSISPREAELMDPQHRLLLLHTWKAIEDAGYAPSSLSGSNTGVFVGTGLSDYGRLLAQAGVRIDGFTAIGTVPSVGPNRVSFLLNLRGPSEPVETSCSSSLVAVHRAVNAIRSGQCDIAIAGGVNTILTPDLHISCTKAGMLSHEGRCKTFSNRADGYVRSEGVGILMLKKLSAAEADGDSIHGVILGSAENHGGRASSFTAPNPQAQAELLRRAYLEADVDPATVGYIEAHGTGTELGDPIEIDALKTAFGDLYARRGATPAAAQCGIGSVKSNIGHLELAAGVAGLIKVLLQLRHRTLVPSIHTEVLNPYIQLDGTPFYIVREARDWTPPRANGNDLPRRAGVSSFGFGGVNAHVVVEEYRPRTGERRSPQRPSVVVLSARDEARLREQAASLLATLRRRAFAPEELSDVAYTLQVGRDAMDARLGCIVSSFAELEAKLQAFLDGADAPKLYRGDAQSNHDVLSVLTSDDAFHTIVDRWLEQEQTDKLLELWVKGLKVDWARLHAATQPRRVSLPTYPFARESYWVPAAGAPRGELSGAARLHPLVHENTSDLTEQRYRTTLTGQELFLADHRVDGRRWLPAVAYLEMAREAVARAASDDVLTLREIVWVRPVAVGSEPVELQAALAPEAGGAVSFEIYGRSGDAPETEIVYARGIAMTGTRGEAPRLDVAKLASRHETGNFSAEACYAAFDAMGIAFGPAHRGLEGVHVDGDTAIARVSLPAAAASARGQYTLHPSVMDAALQTTVGFSLAAGTTERALPFALDALEIHGATPESGWVVARRVTEDASGVARYDLELCDTEGRVCAVLRDLSTRRAGAVAETTAVPPVEIDRDDLHRELETALTRIAAKLLKLPAEHFRPQAQFHDLGFDSILLIAFSDQLKGELGLDVTPPLFFQHPSIERLARHLLESHRAGLAAHFAAAARPAAEAAVVPAENPERRVRRTRTARAVAASGAPEPIAIVGISGRFPMAKDVDELWANLAAGRDCIEEIPPQRWDWRAVWGDPGLENKTNVKWGGFIEGVDEFDAPFFNIPPREAELMDPQQRLLLQHVWKAVEDAGYAPSSLAGSNTGVFVATGMSDYARIVARAQVALDGHTAMGTAASSVGPNRISYLLDLHGPSEPIETTCSSSLVAVHRAVSAMRAGHCDMALVGGVNTILTPDLHISCTKAGMLSSEGRCKTFSRGANGFVRSEGVGILMLKKLSDAEAAGDHVYGVILGTAENHGGRASSFTSPNPEAQAELLRRAYLQAAVDPSSVTYIEAHGTGTELGDPIEIEGLKTAFAALYEHRGMPPVAGHCGIGAVKSNIGHLELAAGVAGMVKVLLQMKHRTLVPTLHCRDVNPYIQLENSPFYLVRETREWTALRGADGSTLPRRAGVSSFGFGGVNAHVVLEEYRPRAERRASAPEPRPALVVLSARDQERLREQVEGLVAAIRRGTYTDADLTAIAYTLQAGREAMDARFGCAVHTLAELDQKLQAFLDTSPAAQANDRAAAKAVRLLTADEDFRGVIDRWIEQGRFEKLLDLWLSGANVEWERIYKDARPRRLALPTYPFARRRCWVSQNEAPQPAPAVGQANDVLGYPFSTVVTGEEFFLTDHVVHGRKVLPAVVYLEMARAAAERAGTSMVRRGTEQPGITLHSVVWARPFVAKAAGARVQLRLTVEGGGELKFQLFGETGGHTVVYGQGRATAGVSGTVETIDVATIRARCTQQRYSAADCYRAFEGLGYHYGPAHQGIVELHVGGDELLAQLHLPDVVADTLHDFVLHPSIGDSAAQSVIGFMLAGRRSPDEPLRPALPFELQTAEIFGACATEMWAHIRRSGGTYDIDLCDASGRVTTRLRGWTTRPIEDDAPRVTAHEQPDLGSMWMPTWEVASVERQDAPAGPVVVAGGTDAQRAAIGRLHANAQNLELDGTRGVEAIRDQLAAIGAIGHLVWLVPPVAATSVADEMLIAAQREGVFAGFRLIQALLAEGYGDRPLTWTVVTADTTPAHATVHGLIGAAAKEYPGWNVRLFDLAGADEEAWSDLFVLRAESHGNPLVRRDGRWYRQQLVPYRPEGAPAPAGRDGEVYVIVGGAGGIGAAWSEALLRRAKVQLVWIGRRGTDEALEERLARLAQLGPAPLYIAADATDRAALEAARATILQRFGRIDGLVHGALVLKDRTLANMTEEDFAAGLAPKVDVSVRLAQVFAQDAPQFVLFFSSLNAFAKSAGQSNYVAGCTFEDAFARSLAAEWPRSRVRVVNWGYWGSVGAVASDRYRTIMARKGFGSIEAADAAVVLDHLLAGPVAQLAYAKTTAPAAIDGITIRDDEWISHYDETAPSCLAALEPVRPEASELDALRNAASSREELDASLTDLLWAQLQSMRVFDAARGGISERYTRWLDHSFALLASRGYVVRNGAWSVSPSAPADVDAAWQSWEGRKAQWLADANWSAHAQLAETALRALPDILTERRSTTDILFADIFGDAASSVVGRVTRGGAPIRFCNRVLAGLAARYVAERTRRDPAARVRILEIGAGTGSTTEVVLDAITPHAAAIAEYNYTDVSLAFVSMAGKWLRTQPPYLKFSTFDVERPAAEQGLAAGGYDLVIASNVLHATKDIGRTLRHAKSLLGANGLLLLNELAGNSVFNHLTFGLLDGWWLFTDAELRVSGGPALRPESWQAALELEGFRGVRFPAAPTHDLGHLVVVAESDGVIRHSAAAASQPHPAVVEEAPRTNIVHADPSDVSPSLADLMTRPRDVAVEYLMSDLRLRVARTLGADPMTLAAEPQSFADALLGEFGMDSLSSNDLRNVLRQELGVDIPVQRIIGEPVRSIVDAIYDQMLLRHMTTAVVDAGEEEEHRETFVF